ncbi:hypothetical protein [Sodalis sp.]|uniref:hypothetical protein n=1 Tax=Sodalis sp. (in: enterobacteria) TaxID=1898979 RepID=UPI0038735860
MNPLIVLNNMNLLTSASRADVERRMAVYRRISYLMLMVSSHTGEGHGSFPGDAGRRANQCFRRLVVVSQSSLLNALAYRRIRRRFCSISSPIALSSGSTPPLPPQPYHFSHGSHLTGSLGHGNLVCSI